MRQVACPSCGAPMWQNGRCPWDYGLGCVGRSLRVNVKAIRRPVTVRSSRVAPVRTLREEPPARPRSLRLSPEEAHIRKVARSMAYNIAHRITVTARCLYDGAVIEVHHGGPARKYCSARCRGRIERGAA